MSVRLLIITAAILVLVACGSHGAPTPIPTPTLSCPTEEERAYILELRDHFVAIEAASSSAAALSSESLEPSEWQTLFIEQMLRLVESATALDVVEAPASIVYIEDIVDDIIQVILDYAQLAMRGAANDDVAAMEASVERALDMMPLMQSYGDALEGHCEK